VVPVCVFIGRSDFIKLKGRKKYFYYEKFFSTVAEGMSNLMAKSVRYSAI
jgi:hypothetical protein